tara:strand:- start:13924 stop:15330 length:1407 start_codon:yes stop_codon:yes gene_type:complete
MNKKYTYKPTSSVKYRKGGKNKKKTYRSDGKHYNAQLGWLADALGSLWGISSMENTLQGIYDDAIIDQGLADTYGVGLAEGVEEEMGFGPSTQLQDYFDQGISLTKPKKASTEFTEGIKDTIGQQTAGITQDIARTGKMTGIKDVLGSADQAYIQAQEKAAGMDERYQQQLTDIEKFETGQETSLINQLGQQEFGADQAVFDLAGDLTTMSAGASGDLAASALAGLVELQGQEAAATSDLVSGVFESLLSFIPGFDIFQSDEKLKENIEKVGETESGVPVSDFDYKKDKDAPEGPGRYRGVIAQDLVGTEHEDAVKKINKNTLGVDYDMLDIQLQKIEGEGEEKEMKAEKGAKMQEYEEGAKQDMMPANEADVTPGKFSHKENPIDIVQDGEKIGEMTGGEAIMPPKDVNEFEQLIADGDKNAVFNKLKQLFAKWDKNAREHAEKNMDQDAMGGAKMGYRPKPILKYN